MDKLQEIIENKIQEVKLQQEDQSLEELQLSPNYQRQTISLKALFEQATPGLIAEFKRKSPSKGMINANADLASIVKGYQQSGAFGISVLSDEKYFAGSLEDLELARSCLLRPLLRKDFIVDPYQVHQAKAYGADLILLIARVLSKSQLDELSSLAKELELETLLEIYDSKELEQINLNQIDILGVNNRNLSTFETDIQHSIKIAADLPDDLIKISESGISSVADAVLLYKAGFDGFLMGESFMRSNDPGQACNEFLTELRQNV